MLKFFLSISAIRRALDFYSGSSGLGAIGQNVRQNGEIGGPKRGPGSRKLRGPREGVKIANFGLKFRQHLGFDQGIRLGNVRGRKFFFDSA